jgi:hypothetical protein
MAERMKAYQLSMAENENEIGGGNRRRRKLKIING